MQLHIVGGFLGSGKTTAIISAAHVLMAQQNAAALKNDAAVDEAGKAIPVAVITNDQGKFLVDSAFVSLAHLPNVEVTGGCFCCNYDDLDQRLDQVIETYHPQVIFAESVGSCADLVATVIKPMLQLRPDDQAPTSFSVFTDARLMRLFLAGEPLPFSDEISYIFGKQIEETRLVILNKIDLLTSEQKDQLLADFAQRFPEKTALSQCSLTPEGIYPWLEYIQSGRAALPTGSLDIDYQKYGRGEARLAWVDEAFVLNTPQGSGHQAALDCIQAVFSRIAARHIPVGHIKFLFNDEAAPCKVSLTTLTQPGWQKQVSEMRSERIPLLINARAECPAADLRALLEDAIRSTGWLAEIGEIEAFHPKQPNPTHRF